MSLNVIIVSDIVKGVKKTIAHDVNQLLKIFKIDPIIILVFDGACKDLSIDTFTRFLTQSLSI